MSRYDEKILNELITKYENSLLYTGENQRRQRISVAITKKLMPEYFDEASLQYDEIHSQLMEQEQKGYLQVVWKNNKKGHIIEKCVLCPEKADEIYQILNRKGKRERENRFLSMCSDCKGSYKLVDNFLHWLENQIICGKSVKKYVDIDNPEQLRELCFLIGEILSNTEEVFWREFSVRFYNDSKIAEKELTRAAIIIKSFSSDDNFKNLDLQQILEEFEIYETPSWIMIKGCGRFSLENQDNKYDDMCGSNADAVDDDNIVNDNEWIDLMNFPGGIGVSSTDIPQMRWDFDSFSSLKIKRILTIENLTSFHRWNDNETLAIYLGGYHNRAKRSFLKNLYKFCSNSVVFEHFGDIDCGGFSIWKNLCVMTGIPFRTRFMDESTYLNYRQYGKRLTDYDKKTLKKLLKDPFYEEQYGLFQLMIKNNIKIEQECVII